MTNLLLTCDWHIVINALPCLLWGILIIGAILTGGYFWLKYYWMPNRKYIHEEEIKEKADNREKEWAGFGEMKKSTDEALKKKIEEMELKIKELESEIRYEKYNNDILKKQLKMYSDIFEDLKIDLKVQEK